MAPFTVYVDTSPSTPPHPPPPLSAPSRKRKKSPVHFDRCHSPSKSENLEFDRRFELFFRTFERYLMTKTQSNEAKQELWDWKMRVLMSLR